MKTLQKIFRIYTDASVAVLMAAGCLIETVCTLALPSFFHILTIPAAAFFGIVSVSMAELEKKHPVDFYGAAK